MGNYQNELEQFIYDVCFQPIWEEAARYISEHPYALDLSKARIKYPTSAYLENMAIEFTCNIHIVEDILSFDAVASCAINLIEETEWRCGNTDSSLCGAGKSSGACVSRPLDFKAHQMARRGFSCASLSACSRNCATVSGVISEPSMLASTLTFLPSRQMCQQDLEA